MRSSISHTRFGTPLHGAHTTDCVRVVTSLSAWITWLPRISDGYGHRPGFSVTASGLGLASTKITPPERAKYVKSAFDALGFFSWALVAVAGARGGELLQFRQAGSRQQAAPRPIGGSSRLLNGRGFPSTRLLLLLHNPNRIAWIIDYRRKHTDSPDHRREADPCCYRWR